MTDIFSPAHTLLRQDRDKYLIRVDEPRWSERVSDIVQQVHMAMLEHPIYRLEVSKTNTVTIDYHDLTEKFDPRLEPAYDDISAMPRWAQERIAMLLTTPHDAETKPDIPGVGRRISATVFWVYPPLENDHE